MDAGLGTRKWAPHIYVNKNDWISYFYIHIHGTKEMDPTFEQNEAKLFVVSMEDQKFLEAHGLKQWWSNDGNRNNKLVIAEVKSLNTGTPFQVVFFYYPRYVSLVTSCINIREATDYVWSILKCMPRHISGKAQINNDGEVSSGIGLVGWIPSLSGLKDTGYWVCKWIPRMYVYSNGGTEEKMVGKDNIDPEDGQITPKLLIFSKEQLKFLASHGLEQWWPNAVELQKTICDGKLLLMFDFTIGSCNIHTLIRNFNCTCNLQLPFQTMLRSVTTINSKLQTQCKNIRYRFHATHIPPSPKKMIHRLSCFMDAGLGTRKWAPHIYVNKNDWISYFYIHIHGTKEMDPTFEQNEAKLFVVSMEDQKFLEAHGLKQWWSNDGNHNNKLVIMEVKSLNTGTPFQVVFFYYPRYVSLVTSCINIREATDYVWSILKCMPRHISGKAQINNDGEVSSGIGLVGWIPSLSGLKDTGYWVCKWIPRMYVYSNGGTEEKMVGKDNIDPEDGQITPKLLIFSKEQLKFLASHGLEQWWPNAVELQKTICDGKL
ncbi:hypothetical protein RYX36_019499, partial [Vicia faba]